VSRKGRADKFLTEKHVGKDVSNAADGEALLCPLAHSEAVSLVNTQHLQNKPIQLFCLIISIIHMPRSKNKKIWDFLLSTANWLNVLS
jgi:hypothetical protein